MSTADILLTNDDGIDAPGLRTLWSTVRRIVPPEINVQVFAPDRQRSECGHTVTTKRPLTIRQVEPNWFSIDGTPVDCVRVAIAKLSRRPAMVLSGINAGANLGVDLLVSGTFAAAREAAIEGIHAMSVSQYCKPEIRVDWRLAESWLLPVVEDFRCRTEASSAALLWNTNLPALPTESTPPTIHRCGVDPSPMLREPSDQKDQIRFQCDFHSRPRIAGSDVDLCFSGAITISELHSHIVSNHPS